VTAYTENDIIKKIDRIARDLRIELEWLNLINNINTK
jgi:hypothetical protein